MDEIEELVIPNAGQQFTGDDFRMLTKPGVYVFMDKGKALYVGMSNALIQRAASKSHRQSNRAREWCDKVLLYPCVSVEAARKLEVLLVSRLRPLCNTNLKYVDARKILGVSRTSKLI